MPGIVCAIRGGPASEPTIRKAIELATETGLRISFTFVVNLDFCIKTESSRVHSISEKLGSMGELIILTAQDKAEAQDVESEGLVRHGKVRAESFFTPVWFIAILSMVVANISFPAAMCFLLSETFTRRFPEKRVKCRSFVFPSGPQWGTTAP